jgi:hypothetical protein
MLWLAGCCTIPGGTAAAMHVIVTESKQPTFAEVPAVVRPSSHSVMFVPVATTVPLNAAQFVVLP